MVFVVVVVVAVGYSSLFRLFSRLTRSCILNSPPPPLHTEHTHSNYIYVAGLYSKRLVLLDQQSRGMSRISYAPTSYAPCPEQINGNLFIRCRFLSRFRLTRMSLFNPISWCASACMNELEGKNENSAICPCNNHQDITVTHISTLTK